MGKYDLIKEGFEYEINILNDFDFEITKEAKEHLWQFTEKALQSERERMVEEVKDLIDEFNDLEPEAIKFGVRITKPLEFGVRLNSLTQSKKI